VPKSEWDRRSKEVPPDIDLLTFCIVYRDREILYERIDRRVDEMIKSGLADETRFLMENGYLSPDTTAGQAIGYKEYACYLRGEISEDEAIEKIKLATRHYAKRQLTWFSAKEDIIKIYADKDGAVATPEALCDEISERIVEFCK
jgi:tRNA dimethylallyltransferase